MPCPVYCTINWYSLLYLCVRWIVGNALSCVLYNQLVWFAVFACAVDCG